MPVVSPTWKTLIPREHGAWAMLLVPFIVAAAVAGRWDVKVTLLLGAVLCLYVARNPLFIRIRTPSRRFPRVAVRWWLLCATAGLSLGAGIMAGHRLWWLVPAGALASLFLVVSLYLARRRQERSVAGEMLGIVALTMTAPTAYYVAIGSLNGETFLLWLLNMLFFGTSVFYVKMKVEASVSRRGIQAKRAGPGYAQALVAYVVATLLLIGGISLLGIAPALVLLAFVPMSLQTVAGLANANKAFNIKRLGFSQLGHSMLFGALLAGAFYW